MSVGRRYIAVMRGNKQKGMVRRSPAGPIYGYAEVEAALAKVYDAEDAQRTAFRGRLKHFRKLGIPQQQPGKGIRIRYTMSDIFQLMIACEFAEFGIDPYLITEIVRRHWRNKSGLYEVTDYALKFPGDDFHVVIETHFMSWIWNRQKSKRTPPEISMSRVAEPVFVHRLKASDIKNIFLDELKKPGRRFFVFNLSARMRDVTKALTDTADVPKSALPAMQ